MFAKVFSQIFDSSIVESPETRFTFMDFLILADRNGVVDMTHEAIARRTNRPVELIRSTITELEAADPRSRTPDLNGARIFRLDEHRDWGWGIVNYDYFRKLASEEQRREKTLQRVRKHRVTQRNAPLRKCNDSPSPSLSPSSSVLKGKRVQREVDIPATLLALPGFTDEWQGFIEVRKSKKAPMTDHSAALILKRLAERPEQAVDALQTAIIARWTGFEWSWYDGRKEQRGAGLNGQMSPQHRQNRINYLNEKKQKTNRMIKDPQNPPSWAVKELEKIDAELREL